MLVRGSSILAKLLKPPGILVLLFGAFLLLSNRQRNQSMKDRLYKALLLQGFGVHMAKLIVAQSAHETGGWTSAIFRENNNPFGMKQALIRPTTSTGTARGHATFDSIESAVLDFRYYWRALGYNYDYATPEIYAQVLKTKKYYEADYSLYSAALRRWYNQLWENEN